MQRKPLQILPIEAPVQSAPFNLYQTLVDALKANEQSLQEGDVLALSSKYMAISEDRIVNLDDVKPTDEALELAARYNMDVRIAQLVVQEAEHIFGGIPL